MSQTGATVVLKFGGTSVAGADRLQATAAIADHAARQSPILLVVSAMAGVTDALLTAVTEAERRGSAWRSTFAAIESRHLVALNRIGGRFDRSDHAVALRRRLDGLRNLLATVAATGDRNPQMRARILASGERLSVILLAAALRGAGRRAFAVDGTELIVTDSEFLEAEVDFPATGNQIRRRLARLPPAEIPVVTGFIGADRAGRTTLLGRGGSDFSATLVGSALDARRVEIWTDVPGVLSAPPRWVPDATTVPRLSQGEAEALARWGGKVLHSRTLAPLFVSGTPVVVGSSIDPGAGRTVITASGPCPRPAVICGRAGVALVPACGHGRPVVDPLDGRPRGEMVETADDNLCDAGLDLAAIALIGRGWDGLITAALRRRRLPVLGLVRELEEEAIGLLIRERHLRRAVKALHDDVLVRRCSKLATRSWRARLEAVS